MRFISFTSRFVGMLLLCLLGTFLLTSIVSAQESTRPTNGQAEARSATRTQIAEGVQTRVITLFTNMTKRAEAGIQRIESIIVRVESRIAKLNADGIDTTIAEARLAETKTALESAKTTLAGLTSPSIALASEKPRESIMALRAGLRTVLSHLQDARTGVMDTLSLLKEAIRLAGASADRSMEENDAPASVE